MYYVYYVRFNGPCDISSNLSSLSVERNSRSVVTGFFFSSSSSVALFLSRVPLL